MLVALPQEFASGLQAQRLQAIELLVQTLGSNPNSGLLALGQPLGAMTGSIHGAAAAGHAQLRYSALIRFMERVTSWVIVRYLRPNSLRVRNPCSPWYTDLSWLVRNISANFRASIRSLLFPSFNRAAFRGSQTISRLTCGFRRSCSQAAEVPSSKVSARVPCSPWMNSSIVAALVSSRHSIISLPLASITATEMVA